MVESLTVVLVVALLAGLVWAWRRASVAAVPGPRRQPWGSAADAGDARVVLDLEAADPELPSVQRLVREAAHRVLAADPSLEHVEVVDRDGNVLARERRPDPLPPPVAFPEELREPHATRRRGPSAVHPEAVEHPRTVPAPSPGTRHLPLAARYDLPDRVRAHLQDHDDGPGLVRAILEAAGRQVTRDGDLLRTDDVAIAVVDVEGGADRALNHGFLRIESTDAPRGLIVRLGFVDPATVRRREAAAPHVRHVGPDGLQRMADAVAAGGDPIAFAAAPATVTSPRRVGGSRRR